MILNRKMLLSLMLVFGLFGATIVFAEQVTVPVSTLKPAVHLDKPQLTGVGGPLLLSDSPESFTAPGAFYRDRVSGEFRVFWHHQNKAVQPLTVGLAITNESDEAIKLFSEGVGVATDYYPDVAGQEALTDFMKSPANKKFLTALAPGESYFISSPTDSMFTTSGIAQFVASTQQANDPAEVTVTVLNYTEKPDHPEQAVILPRDSHVRGTFPHFGRTGTLNYNTSLGNAYINISSAASGQYSDSLPGEYETGYDAIDGSAVINNGNYGVSYDLQVEINNSDLHHPRTVALYHNPAGGFGHYVMKWQNKLLESGFLSYQEAWQFAQFTLGAQGGTYKSELSLTGGAAGPSKIFFTNQEK